MKINYLPIISTQFDKLRELEDNVQNAFNLAVQAKEKAENAKVSAGLFKKKAAIEALQEAADGSASALITMAEAQKLSFEYQTQLAKITKYLFGLGVCNIAMNRCVVKELELRLKGAAEEDISELAKQELKNVILQLKSQEDMMKKQEDIKKTQKSLTGKVEEQSGQLERIDKLLDDIEEADEEQDEKIAENTERITKHSKVLSVQQQKDDEHDKKISENAQDIDELERQDEEQDKRIALIENELNKQIENINENICKSNDNFEDKYANLSIELINAVAKLNSEREKQTKNINTRIEDLDNRIDSLNTIVNKKVWKIVISVVAGASLILNFMQIIGII